MLWPAKRPAREHKPKITSSILFHLDAIAHALCRLERVPFIVSEVIRRRITFDFNDVFRIFGIPINRYGRTNKGINLNFAHDRPLLKREREKGEKPNARSKECCATSHKNHIKKVCHFACLVSLSVSMNWILRRPLALSIERAFYNCNKRKHTI